MRLLRRADKSFYGDRTPLLTLGFSSLFTYNPPYILPFGSGTTTDGGKAGPLLARLGAQMTCNFGERRPSMPDLTTGGLRYREEKIRGGGQVVFKPPEDTSL